MSAGTNECEPIFPLAPLSCKSLKTVKSKNRLPFYFADKKRQRKESIKKRLNAKIGKMAVLGELSPSPIAAPLFKSRRGDILY